MINEIKYSIEYEVTLKGVLDYVVTNPSENVEDNNIEDFKEEIVTKILNSGVGNYTDIVDIKLKSIENI